MNYKAPDNSLHSIEPGFAHLLPAGCVPITREEADAIGASKVVPPTYQELRRATYPPIGDQLDALWKGGVDESAMRATINAVKVRFPKA